MITGYHTNFVPLYSTDALWSARPRAKGFQVYKCVNFLETVEHFVKKEEEKEREMFYCSVTFSVLIDLITCSKWRQDPATLGHHSEPL